MKKTLSVAVLGFGVVGGGVAELIEKNSDLLSRRLGRNIRVSHILDLRSFPDSPFADRITPDINVILNDPDVEIVAEALGGDELPYKFSKACLAAGKSVVTSNKEVVAKHGAELLSLARENGVRYIFEASVGGGIPCLRPFSVSLAVNPIRSVDGILNGTTNFILTEMTENGSDFASVLSRAQELGYAEKDPTADVEGFDAARKIVILCAMAYGVMPTLSDVNLTGITKITPDLLSAADSLGCKIKLVAHASLENGTLYLSVAPAFVSRACPLYAVDGVFNAVCVDSEALDEVMLCGKGAGRYPTASAVVADILEAGLRPDEQPDVFNIENNEGKLPCAPLSDFCGRWVAVLEGKDPLEFSKFFPDCKLTLLPSLGFVTVLTDDVRRGDFEEAIARSGAVSHGVFAYK